MMWTGQRGRFTLASPGRLNGCLCGGPLGCFNLCHTTVWWMAATPIQIACVKMSCVTRFKELQDSQAGKEIYPTPPPSPPKKSIKHEKFSFTCCHIWWCKTTVEAPPHCLGWGEGGRCLVFLCVSMDELVETIFSPPKVVDMTCIRFCNILSLTLCSHSKRNSKFSTKLRKSQNYLEYEGRVWGATSEIF